MLPIAPRAAMMKVCEEIAKGETVSQACELWDVDQRAFRRARMGDPDLQAAFAEAQEIGAEIMADTLANIQDRVRDPLMARVVSENKRWLLARRFAARYGDRLQLDDNRAADLTGVLREAIERIPRPARDQPLVIDAANVTIADIFDD